MFKSERKVVYFNKKTLIISILLTFLCLPLNVNAINVAPTATYNYYGTGVLHQVSFNNNSWFESNSTNQLDSNSYVRFDYSGVQHSQSGRGSVRFLFRSALDSQLGSASLQTSGIQYVCNVSTGIVYPYDVHDYYLYSIYCEDIPLYNNQNFILRLNLVTESNYYSFSHGAINYGIDFYAKPDSDSTIIQNQEQIKDAIEGDDLTNDDKIDDAPIKDYQDKEDAIIDTDVLDKINDIQIAIDSNSNLFIWNLVDNILNTHSLVFGMFIAILSLGLIKLILNR